MKRAKLADMKGGWFVGDFAPSVVRSSDFETAIKKYTKGQREPEHYHARTTEITVIVTGRARMMGEIVEAGDILLLEHGEATGFEALEDTITCVVKFPSVPDDKVVVG